MSALQWIPTSGRRHAGAPPYDVRVPLVVLAPQVGTVLALAGDAGPARAAFVLAVAVNVPLMAAGRLPWLLERSTGLPVSDVAVAVARPLTALLYAGALLVIAGPTASAAVRAATWSSVVAAGLLLVLPGGWTPAGRLLQARRRVGRAQPWEIAGFVARRASFVALLAVPWLAGYGPVLWAAAALLVALATGLPRPRQGPRPATTAGASDPIAHTLRR